MNNQYKHQKYLEKIASIPSIKFIDFDYSSSSERHIFGKAVVMGDIPSHEVSTIDRFETEIADQITWFINILKEHDIMGDVYFSFGTLPFAHVHIADYSWVEATWDINPLTFDFITLDLKKYLCFLVTEQCTSNNCLGAYIAYNLSTQL